MNSKVLLKIEQGIRHINEDWAFRNGWKGPGNMFQHRHNRITDDFFVDLLPVTKTQNWTLVVIFQPNPSVSLKSSSQSPPSLCPFWSRKISLNWDPFSKSTKCLYCLRTILIVVGLISLRFCILVKTKTSFSSLRDSWKGHFIGDRQLFLTEEV